MLVENFRYEIRGNEGLLTNDFDEALDFYNSLEGEKAFWDLKHMKLLASSQDDDVCPDSGNYERRFTFLNKTMDTKKSLITIAVFMIAIIAINCFKQEPEDYYCVTCIDRAMIKKDQTYCGKLNTCKEFMEYVIISTVSIDSVSWECTIQ